MSEMNKLDNISNMSDEELDAFIKSELNSSLMEDIKVDEELISKTMEAVNEAEQKEAEEDKNNRVVSFDDKKSGINIRKFMPILSMAACLCIIVMAGSLIYSKLDMKKSDKVDNNKSNPVTEENIKDDASSIVDGQEQHNSILNNQSGIQSDQKYDEDMSTDNFEDGFCTEDTAPESDQESAPESDQEFTEDVIGDKNEQVEDPEAVPDETLEWTPSTDVIYEISKILKIKDDNDNYLSKDMIESGDAIAILYDEAGIELGQDEFLKCIKNIYEKSKNDMIYAMELTFDEHLIPGLEHIYINIEAREYYILLDFEEGNDEINIVVMEKQ